MQSIPLYTRSVYGRPLVYCADPKQAHSLRQLTNSTTLSPAHLAALGELGHTFRTVPDPQSPLASLPNIPARG